MNSIWIGCPIGYAKERSYVFSVIFSEFLGLPYELKEIPGQEVEIRLAEAPDDGVIRWKEVLFQRRSENWLTALSLPSTPLAIWNVTKDLSDVQVVNSLLPIIYGKSLPNQQWFEHNGREIRLGLDITGSIFFMLTRYEELVLPDRDKHSRFSARSSLAYKEGFLDRPIVDEYVEVLWACMKRLWPGLERKKLTYRVCLSHDVDEPLEAVGKPWFKVLKSAMGDLIKRQSVSLATRRLVAKATSNYERDVYNTFGFIMDVSERYGLMSTFFFKAGCSNPSFDQQYSLSDPWIQRLMRAIHERGFEIGLHPSYESYKKHEIVHAEYERLLRVADQLGISQPQWGSRQHFLRWENPTTWQILNDAGIAYDATLGFADHIGFRCGTCREFPVFNLKTRQALHLWEHPLIAMDTTLLASKYMGLRLERIPEQIMRLGYACRLYDGTLRLLWHNTNLVQESQQSLYLNIVKGIVESGSLITNCR